MGLAAQKNRRIFLLRCKHMDVYPTFLNFNLKHIELTGTYFENKFQNIIKNTKSKILNLVLTQTTKTINNLNGQLDKMIHDVKLILPANTLDTFLNNESKKYEKSFNNIKQRNQKKISKLISCQEEKVNTDVNTQKWLKNISDTEIPNDVSQVLALGDKFSLPVNNEKQLPLTEYISSIEAAIKNKPVEIKENIRSDVVNVITNHKIKTRHKKTKHTLFQKNIQKKINKTKQFIKDNPQITVLKPDKSNKTVIMNTDDYETKIGLLLNDPDTYKKLKYDPTKSYQNKNNSYIKKLASNKLISDDVSKYLTIHNAVAPKIYGLPKLHKPNIPLRPIVSCIQSPFYKLSKYISNILSKITGKNEYYIKDSFTFKEFIDKTTIPLNYKLISLDVISLYTNIPIEIVAKILKERWDMLKIHTTLPYKEFVECVNLALKNSYCQYKNEFYQQVDGCAMGSPISSTIAQIVMEYLEENVLQKLNYNIVFFKRYVDDCLLAIPEDKITQILNDFNNFHPKLQFTSEVEKNNQINFLDLTIIRSKNDNTLKTKWYTKDTWSGRYLSFNSHHPNSQKYSVIIGLTDRAIALTSPQYRPEILKKVRKTLITNHFPEKLINKIFKKRTQLYYNKNKKINQKTESTEPKTYIAVPYIVGLSEKIKYILNKFNIVVCDKSFNLLNKFFTPLKSPIPIKKRSNVIYSIPCLSCPLKYIGMTTQYLENRINGHKYTKNASTALHKHEDKEKHEFDFSNTKILNKDSNYNKLVFKEMIHIKKDKNIVNDKKDIQNLSQIYYSLIK